MTALCPFLKKYEKVIQAYYPDITIIHGTHTAKDNKTFQNQVKELLCPTVSAMQDMNDVIKGTVTITKEK